MYYILTVLVALASACILGNSEAFPAEATGGGQRVADFDRPRNPHGQADYGLSGLVFLPW